MEFYELIFLSVYSEISPTLFVFVRRTRRRKKKIKFRSEENNVTMECIVLDLKYTMYNVIEILKSCAGVKEKTNLSNRICLSREEIREESEYY